MTQNDKEFLKEFLIRAGFTGIIVGVFFIFLSSILWFGSPKPQQQSTTVVGQYKECDIVQWTNGDFAEYKYFLYCSK